ncbi:type II toxin-antitoxin system RelE/ParE family toxin [Enhygromyxa salina]|uniref:Plasmid stabilization system protein n=1 Tax=Enhygromyxa salina TaxID=215803 RepID=A0A2S9YLY2_9BACT|nr:type II toxin-antitoxin system RelE/ParE family toxin [Enhygromyxa salina]PRQ06107.1 Plasmid stabilization system protein [Enhygromyxa salina]
MREVEFFEEAAAKLEEATDYLEQQRDGLARTFLRELDAKLQQLASFPASAPIIEGVATDVEVRAFVVSRFHYSVIVINVDGALKVVALAHHSRDPTYWLARLS